MGRTGGQVASPPSLVAGRWLEQFYDAYPRIESEFQAVLEEGLNPRGPDVLYDLVEEFALSPGSVAVDVGCGEGKHAVQLAERFPLMVAGVDPVLRHVELARAELTTRAALQPELEHRVSFALGTAEALPLEDGTVDLVWCRDVLVHVADLDRAYVEFRRVLRPNGRVLVYQMFAGDRIEPREAEWLWRTMGVVATSADRAHTDAAISAAGLRIDHCIDLGTDPNPRVRPDLGVVAHS